MTLEYITIISDESREWVNNHRRRDVNSMGDLNDQARLY